MKSFFALCLCVREVGVFSKTDVMSKRKMKVTTPQNKLIYNYKTYFRYLITILFLKHNSRYVFI